MEALDNSEKSAALAIFLDQSFQTYIYAGRPSSCQLLIINSYTENCLWSDDFMAPVYKEFRVQNSPVDICAEHMEADGRPLSRICANRSSCPTGAGSVRNAGKKRRK